MAYGGALALTTESHQKLFVSLSNGLQLKKKGGLGCSEFNSSI